MILSESVLQRFDGLPALIGVCGVGARVLEVPSPIPGLDPAAEGAYIVAFGTDAAYHGRKLKDKPSRPGDALMVGTLAVIAQVSGTTMPFVKARILPDNDKSRRLFDEHGFDNLGFRGGQDAVFRPPGLEPPFRRDQTWSSTT